MRVVMIDSEVDRHNASVMKDNPVIFEWDIRRKCLKTPGKGRRVVTHRVQEGHGTAIHSIIRECRDIAEIIIVSVPYLEEQMKEEDLLACIQAVEDEIRPDFYNLSLGLDVCEQEDSFRALCESIRLRGGVILAAFDNDGAYAYPACFDSVIGVYGAGDIRRKQDYKYVLDDEVNLLAYGGRQIVEWSDPPKMIVEGNSFACAHATVIAVSLAAKYCSDGPVNLFRIKQVLQEHADETVRFIDEKPQMTEKERWNSETVEKVAIFPLNKEMQVLCENDDLLSFSIVDIYDVRQSLRIGRRAEEYLHRSMKNELYIEDIRHIQWDEFDTLIVGHLKELSRICGRDLWSEIVPEALKRGKRVFSLDSPRAEAEGKKGLYYPRVEEKDVPVNKFGMMHVAGKPVLGVFGTGSGQGKFTLQLAIRREMLRRGYRIGQIGTEPTSELFGIDEVFPIGYQASVRTRDMDNVLILNEMVHSLCRKEVDMIIAGSQSGTVTYSNQNFSLYNMMQYEFLLGTWPDAVILCVNPYDDTELIRRTISFIESSCHAKVIGINLFPLSVQESPFSYSKIKLSMDELENKRELLSREIGLKIFIGYLQIERIVDLIEDYFGEEAT
ncbi:MAG: DUF1611 domain-containing protein [Lachnospiraceae bacterium]|nr:DUF1611 domain-containing protein [Lachnospiraceae bacterium]